MDKLRYFSINQLSKVTGKDRATITKRLENTKPYKEDGRARIYDGHEVLPMIFAAEQVKGMSKKTELVAYEIEKEKLNKIRMDNDAKLGKLVEIDEVAKVVEKEYTFVKAQIKAIPAKCSKICAMETDPAIINKILTDTINETLGELISDQVYAERMKEMELIENERSKFVTESSNTESKENSNATADSQPS